jgi:hypothetical protein
VELSCGDGASGNAPTRGAGPAVGGLIFESRFGNVEGSSATDAGLGVPKRQRLYFAKAPAWLRAGAARTTIELSASSGGYLAWVPAQIWTSGRGIDLRQWMTSKLVFDSCRDRDITYLGGLLSTDPHMCLTLHVTVAAGESRQIRVGSTAHC